MGAPPTGDLLSVSVNLPPDRTIGSLWRRVLAIAADGIIIGIAGNSIALPFFEPFSRLGAWGRLLGFCIALPYFAALNSTFGNGKTLGKRWMHLQVVNKNGMTIPFWKSVVRYAVLAIPFFLNEIELPITRTPWVVFAFISLIIFGVGGATLYLVFFNRHTRQGLHDLAVGSYVADAHVVGPLRPQPIWKAHWVILGSSLVLLVFGTGILGNKLAKWGPFPQLLEDARLLEGLQGVQSAGVQDLTRTVSNSSGRQKVLVLNVNWTGRRADEIAFADQVAQLILKHDSKVPQYDLLRVTVTRSYDLGIAYARVSRFYEHTPEEWKSSLPEN